jgi:hypothetical protein
LEPLIENFEAQSGDGLGPLTDSTYISVINVTNVPEPEVSPVSSSPANVEFLQNQRQEAKAERKRVARATRTVTNSQTLEAVADLTSSINSQMSSGFDKIVQAIQAKSESASVPQTPLPSPLEGVNWTPIIQGLVSGLAASFGASVNLPTSAPAAPAATPAPAVQPSVKPSPLETRINALELKMTTFATTLDQRISRLASSVDSISTTVERISTRTDSQISQLSSTLNTFIKAMTPTSTSSNSNGSNNNSNGAPPFSFPEITSLAPVKPNKPFIDQIVTADLEAVIDSNGNNLIYMAAWYNGTSYNILDISYWVYNSNTMLEMFWQDLIRHNFGKKDYFHNWGGYDSILSLTS